MWKSYTATVDAVGIRAEERMVVTEPRNSINLEFGGVEGDIHFGLTKPATTRERMYPRDMEIRNFRQVSVVSSEECAEIASRLGVENVQPGWLCANIALRDFPDLSHLPAGSHIIFPSGAGIACVAETLPCVLPGRVIQLHYPRVKDVTARFVKAALHRRGIQCVVTAPGTVSPGDQATIYVPTVPRPSENRYIRTH